MTGPMISSPDWSLTNRLSYSQSSTRQNDERLGAGHQSGDRRAEPLLDLSPRRRRTRHFATNLDLKGKFDDRAARAFGAASATIISAPICRCTLLSSRRSARSTSMRPIIGSSTIPIGDPIYGTPGQKWTGVYGQDMISFFDDSVHVLLGGRYDWAETGSTRSSRPTRRALASYVTVYTNAFSPRVGVVYQPLPWLSLYGNFTQSFGVNNTTTHRAAAGAAKRRAIRRRRQGGAPRQAPHR